MNSHLFDPAQVHAAQREEIVHLMLELERKPEHARHVAHLALQIFDQTRALHGCAQNERLLLEFAALLHDIGWSISEEKHHTHSMRLIECASFAAVDYASKCLIAQIARYHRKSLPKAKHKKFVGLSPNDQMIVKKMAAILRLADALDRSHSSRIRNVTCSIREMENECILTVSHSEILADESMALEKKKDLFVRVFGLDVRLVNEAVVPELAAVS